MLATIVSQTLFACEQLRLLHLRGFYMELLGAGVSADVGDHADCLLSGDYGRLQFGGLVGASTHRGHLKSGRAAEKAAENG